MKFNGMPQCLIGGDVTDASLQYIIFTEKPSVASGGTIYKISANGEWVIQPSQPKYADQVLRSVIFISYLFSSE